MSEAVVTYEIKIPSTQTAVTLDEVKAHSRIDYNDDDALLTQLLTAAEAYVEKMTGWALGAKTITIYADLAGCSMGVGWFPLLPILDTIDYKINPNKFNLLAAGNDPQPGYAIAPFDVQVGYTSATIPFDLKLAVMKIVSTAYESREDTQPGYERTMAGQNVHGTFVIGGSSDIIRPLRRRVGI